MTSSKKIPERAAEFQGRQREVTALLAEVGRGDPKAWDKLLPLVFQELRKLADNQMRNERLDHTLQPTALVNEAFLRLVQQEHATWENRSHFYGAAAKAMRRILVDHARRRRSAKRGGSSAWDAMDETFMIYEERSTDLLALDEALTKLAAIDPQQSQIIELRFFSRLTAAETAHVLGISQSAVERSWRVAKAWLLREINAEDLQPPETSS